MIPNKKLTGIEKQVLDYPTLRFRIRAALVDFKRQLLGNDIETTKAETAKVFKAIKTSFMSETTYKRAWKGMTCPRPETLESLGEAANWLLAKETYTTPIMRHLFCMDASTIVSSSKPEEYHQIKQERMEKAFAAINKVWEVLTNEAYTSSSDPFDFFSQVSWSELKQVSDQCYMNPNVANIPSTVRVTYRFEDSKSIFPFLSTYASICGIEDSPLLDLWSMDMASLTLLFGAVKYENLSRSATNPLGQIEPDYKVYDFVFFSPDSVFDSIKEAVKSEKNQIDYRTYNSWHAFRKSYRKQLLHIGITQEDLDSLLLRKPRSTSVDVGLRS